MEPMQNLSEEMAAYVEQSQEQVSENSYDDHHPLYVDHMPYCDHYIDGKRDNN
jgi:hypothetical protein